MDAAVLLAAQGGLDALRIRDIVTRTGVSSATIYRYFTSKEHLLVAALAEQRFAMRPASDAPPEGTTPAQRVINLLRAPTDALTRAPRLAAAMLRAMTSGEPDVAALLATITEPLVAETAYAIRPGNPTPADHELARTIQRVWFAAVVGWVTANETADSSAKPSRRPHTHSSTLPQSAARNHTPRTIRCATPQRINATVTPYQQRTVRFRSRLSLGLSRLADFPRW